MFIGLCKLACNRPNKHNPIRRTAEARRSVAESSCPSHESLYFISGDIYEHYHCGLWQGRLHPGGIIK